MFAALASLPALGRGVASIAPALGSAVRYASTAGDLRTALDAKIPPEQARSQICSVTTAWTRGDRARSAL